MSSSLQDVAYKAGVSSATASRVLNKRKDPHISEATKQRVMQAARELNYRPNRLARALVTGKTSNIGLWTTGVHPAHASKIIMQTQLTCRGGGYNAHVIDITGMGRAGEIDLAWLFAWPVDGILAFECAGLVDRCLESGDLDSPLVSMGCHISRNLDYVWVDMRGCAAEAVRHLVQSGRKRITYMAPRFADCDGEARGDAYVAVMQESGLPVEKIITIIHGGGLERSHARDVIKSYVSEHGCPHAIFCFNDELAIGCYRGLRDMGFAIPEDVAIVGCDGIDDCEYMDSPITTMQYPVDKMCKTAWEFLLNRIQDPGRSRQEAVYEPTLIVRKSSQQ